MNPNHTVIIIAMLCFGTGATSLAQQNNDDLKQRVLAQAQTVSPEEFAFTRTTRSEATWNTKTLKNVTVEKFDPTKPADARWTLVSVDGAPPSRSRLRKYRKEAAKRRVVPGYHRVANYFGAPATATTEADGTTIFGFDSLPKGSVSILEKDLSKIATAEAVVKETDGTPFVEQVRFTLVPPRRLIIFKINGYETTLRYRIGPGGKPILATATSEMSGSGFGLNGTLHTVTTYSDYQLARLAQQP
jgi:hypothetical protein